jgi:hypothetical protein
MDQIVSPGSQRFIFQVPKHGDVGYQKQDYKNPQVLTKQRVKIKRGKKYSQPFQP